MGKAVKWARFRSVKIKVLRRSITEPAKVSYLYQGLPEPNCKLTHPSDPHKSITPQQAETDDVVQSCSSCSETAYSKAKKRELHAWDAVKDDMLKVSFEGSAPITTQCVVCQEHGDYSCVECSTTAVFCEACLKRTHKDSLHLPDKWNNAYYEPSTLRLFLYLPEGHGTHVFYTKDMKVIVSTGRLCTVTVNMCACEPETCTLHGCPYKLTILDFQLLADIFLLENNSLDHSCIKYSIRRLMGLGSQMGKEWKGCGPSSEDLPESQRR